MGGEPRRPHHRPGDLGHSGNLHHHATVLIQIPGLNITRSVWSKQVSPVTFAGPKRVRAPGITLDALPAIDLILISHNHYDHLDSQSLRAIIGQQRREPVIVTGLGNAGLLRKLATPMPSNWTGASPDRSVTARFILSNASTRSGSVLDQMKTLWGSFVLETPQGNLYFAGDTGYSPHFREQGERWGPFALTLLPIGAYQPRWFMKDIHLNPEEAVRAHQDLGSRQSLGIPSACSS